jgi:signal transduction histidine kinase
MVSAAESTPAAKQANKGWPKVHLIYFVLATFDIIAVLGGLYLSHGLGKIFDQNTASNQLWDSHFEEVWNLQKLASAINEPPNDVFRTQDVAIERSKLKTAAGNFQASLDAVRTKITNSAPDMVVSQPLRTLTYVDQATKAPVDWANEALRRYAAGDIMGATEATSQHDRAFAILSRRLSEAAASVRSIDEAYAVRFRADADKLKQYEWFIGGWLLFMVLCVLTYGQYISRLMRTKYAELAAAHDQLHDALKETAAHAASLETVNEDVTKLNRELHANVQKLRDAQDEIVRKSKMAQLGQLTATVAHELRNPLGAVKTSAFLLARKVKDKGLGVEPQLLRIDSGITRCDNIITQLLDFSRTKQLSLEPVDFDQWLGSTIEEQAASLPASVAIECVLGLNGRKVPIDLPRMQRVVVNLLSNAAEALSRKNDGTAANPVRDPKIIVETKAVAGGGVTLSVIDNGPGISPENLKRIREPLFTTKNFGTGLGIPAIEQILSQHGGHLDIQSDEGKGASFVAWLPAEVFALRKAS